MILDLIAMFICGAVFMACIMTMIILKVFFDREDKKDQEIEEMYLQYQKDHPEDCNDAQ